MTKRLFFALMRKQAFFSTNRNLLIVGVFSLEAVSCCSLRFPTCKEAHTVRSGSIPRSGAQHLGFSWKRDSRPLVSRCLLPCAGWLEKVARTWRHASIRIVFFLTNERGRNRSDALVDLGEISGLSQSFAPGELVDKRYCREKRASSSKPERLRSPT
jgi:hypothetical protein